MGKCPKCEKPLSTINQSSVSLGGLGMMKLHGVAYCCPLCQTIINVQIDPIALKADIVAETVQRLRSVR